MRCLFVTFLFLIFAQQGFASETVLQAATFNLWSWGPQIEERIDNLSKLFTENKLIEDSSVVFLQEVLKSDKSNYAQELADKMNWKSYFQVRVGDSEGLAFVYKPEVQVLSQEALQLKTAYSSTDYRRVALSMQVDDSHFGTIRYVNLHLAHEPYMTQTRKAQLEEVLEWVKQLEEKSASSKIIMGGDFNTGLQETYYQGEFDPLENSSFRLKNCLSLGAPFTWIDFENGKTENVDYFFVSKKDELTKGDPSVKVVSQVTTQKLSDHNLLLLSLPKD